MRFNFFPLAVLLCTLNIHDDLAYLRNCRIKIEAYLENSSKVSSKSVELDVRINNLSCDILKIPKEIEWGLPKDPSADFIFEIKKRNEKGKFARISIFDNFLRVYNEISLVDLQSGNHLVDKFNVAVFYGYEFPKGTYKVRVLFKASKHNNMKDVYSNWAGFTIE